MIFGRTRPKAPIHADHASCHGDPSMQILSQYETGFGA